MFTGLIETIGTVREKRPGSGATRIAVESDLPLDTVSDGDSVAVNGVCLTVVKRSGRRFYADVIQETLDLSTLGSLRTGEKVNLERALALGDRLGGHLVQGHVDGTGVVREVIRQGNDYRLRTGMPGDLGRYVALKGSIAVDGVSLTVSAVNEDWFEAALIPETRKNTGLGRLRRGDAVNLEVDLMARYLARLLQGMDNPR
jgi:riboflavin synthase